MILTLTEAFINEAFLKLNERFDNSLKIRKVNTAMETANMPSSEQAINYNIYITGVTNEEDESGMMNNVAVRIDFVFLKAQKNNDIYKQIVDRYLYPFMRLLNNSEIYSRANYDADISQGLIINNVGELAITNGDRFEDEFFRPSIEMTLVVIDSNNENILSTINL